MRVKRIAAAIDRPRGDSRVMGRTQRETRDVKVNSKQTFFQTGTDDERGTMNGSPGCHRYCAAFEQLPPPRFSFVHVGDVAFSVRTSADVSVPRLAGFSLITLISVPVGTFSGSLRVPSPASLRALTNQTTSLSICIPVTVD
jgi:hypothetical protein